MGWVCIGKLVLLCAGLIILIFSRFWGLGSICEWVGLCAGLIILMFSGFWGWVMIGLIILFIFFYFLIEKYLIYPSSGKQKPTTFIAWLRASIHDEPSSFEELLENIRESFQKSK